MRKSNTLTTLGIATLALLSQTQATPKKGKTMNKSNETRTITKTDAKASSTSLPTDVRTTALEATFIPVTANPGKEGAVAELLRGAADLVKKTEPLTLQWLALREDGTQSRFAIVDFFHEAKGREAHFAGQVAAALKLASGAALVGGWDNGVVAHVENSQVLSYAVSDLRGPKAALAVRIEIKAKTGQEENLADFLAGAGTLVKATEPGTLLWYAIRIAPDTFAIFDVFADADAKAAHFGGKVAAALKANSGALVAGGWDNGVVSNIKGYQVLSATY